jgi:hypothetical protein
MDNEWFYFILEIGLRQPAYCAMMGLKCQLSSRDKL